MRSNREAFAKWRLRQRVLAGHKDVDVAVDIDGQPLALPVILAPTGLTGLAHWSGELAAARAADHGQAEPRLRRKRPGLAVPLVSGSYGPEGYNSRLNGLAEGGEAPRQLGQRGLPVLRHDAVGEVRRRLRAGQLHDNLQ